MFKAMLIAGAGGFIGTCLRYLVGKLAHYVFSSPFPFQRAVSFIIRRGFYKSNLFSGGSAFWHPFFLFCAKKYFCPC